MRGGYVDVYATVKQELTNRTNFEARGDEGKLPGSNIVVSTPTSRLSDPGGWAAAGAHDRRSPILQHQVAYHGMELRRRKPLLKLQISE